MFITLVKGFFSLLGLANWAEKMWGDHELREQGKTEQRLTDSIQSEKEEAKALDNVQKANDFEGRIRNNPDLFDSVRRSTNATE